ncbi:hypothetical protein E1J38_012875 [Seonamhaeicola sediminis]|uniref:Uncharacterized protein n=1 Tax=Seonamhaeicola sediminis TaxID=2528206 RepID=A0A562YC21_9FLAO|nr:hypothetical protein [Seonamhaeicola sediminis]TWO31649.1 hypothetical protein E1J38_012875 [Seonamhaeicola sediminis]
MKKIIYISLSILTIGLFSCSDDDSYSIAYVDDEVKTPLVGTIELNRAAAAPTTKMMEATVTIPQTFDVESIVEVTSESKFGNFLEIETFVEKSYITVPAGATSGVGLIRTAGDDEAVLDDFNGTANFASAFISGIALKQPEEGSIDDPYTMTSDTVSIAGVAYDSSMDPEEESLSISLDWLGPYNVNDLDLYVFNSNFSFLIGTETGDRFEGLIFNDPDDDIRPEDGNDYTVEIAIWDPNGNVTSPIPYRLVFTHPNGDTDIYLGEVDPAIGYIDPVNISKTTTIDDDDNEVITFVTSSAI